MGSSPSKPGATTQHVFSSEHPVQFSENLVKSLQSSSETDSTRAKHLEYTIQQRVTAELEKHLAASSDKFSSLAESISQEPFETHYKTTANTPTSSGRHSYTEKPLLNRLVETVTGSSDSAPSQPQSQTPAPGAKLLPDTASVQKELDELRRKLDARPKLREKVPSVEKAKEQVVSCLQRNEKRPLDCWKELEEFKAEVTKMERSHLASIV